jgi:TfoX/Sxy family transcriptional regulator of competence genes
MTSKLEFVEFIVGQLENANDVTFKKMFGEYAIYSGSKLVALICDDRLLVKPTSGGKSFIGEVVEASPYPGAKPCFLIEEQFEDEDWLCNLIRITEEELPIPKPKKKKVKEKVK